MYKVSLITVYSYAQASVVGSIAAHDISSLTGISAILMTTVAGLAAAYFGE